jgi:flagellar basal-body rod protein FlgB
MESKLANFLFEATGVDRYRRFLDLTSMRHKLISSNVANVATPGYEARDIDFKEELLKSANKSQHLAGAVTHTSHIPLGSYPEKIPEIHSTRVRGHELNSVDIDKEVPKMSQNELEFTIGARLLQKKFEGLRKAIKGQ